MTLRLPEFTLAGKQMDGPKDYQLVEYDPMADPCGHFR